MYRNVTEILLNKAMDHIGETLEQPTDPRAWDHLLVYCPIEAIERRLETLRARDRGQTSKVSP
jgi:hypothetical protein